MAKSYRDSDAFQLALELVPMVYEVTAGFPADERFGVISQMRRAVFSVISQIAEGHGRLTMGERRQFLSQARGSLFEVEAQTLGAAKVNFMTAEQEKKLLEQMKRTGCALNGMIAFVRSEESPRNRGT